MLVYQILISLTEGGRLFANLPYAAVQLPHSPQWVLLAYYAIAVGGWLSSVQARALVENAA